MAGKQSSMSSTPAPIPGNKKPIISRRLKALAVLRYGGLDPFFKRLPWASRTMTLALQRGQVSPAVAEALARELGHDGWKFVTGDSDTFSDEKQEVA